MAFAFQDIKKNHLIFSKQFKTIYNFNINIEHLCSLEEYL